jgi:rubrerythrin
MPSFCPHCHNVLEQDEICCAQVCYTWRCASCRKVSSGFAIPYGKCFLCGGNLELIGDRDVGDAMRLEVVRDAVQFEINSYQFYKLARQRTNNGQLRLIFEQLYEHELDHLHLLEERYHAHLDRSVVDLAPDAEQLLANWLFRDINLSDDTAAAALYEAAISMERRTRDHFRQRAGELPEGLEKDLCLELAAEEEEHVAMLETEQVQFIGKA